MTTRRLAAPTIRRLAAITAIAFVFAAPAGPSVAYAKPIKELVSAHFGWEADASTGEDVCTAASGNECVPGKPSTKTGGFEYIRGVAVDTDSASPHYGDVYATDTTNRVQELAPTGQFVGTFGWEVNETKDKQPGASQEEKNVCTAASGDVCKPGVAGSAPGQLQTGQEMGLAIDGASGDVYVAEATIGASGYEGYGERVQAFTAVGEWMWEMGKEVNETTHGNLCTQQEVETKGVKCTSPAEAYGGSKEVATNEPQAFGFSGVSVLAAGGPDDLLYVGENGRVQELEANGKYKAEIPLKAGTSGKTRDIAVDPSGDIFTVSPVTGFPSPGSDIPATIKRFDASGKQTGDFQIFPKLQNAKTQALSIATDPAGRLAVIEGEEYFVPGSGVSVNHRGTIYNPGSERLQLVSEFADPARKALAEEGIDSVAFGDKDEMYAARQGYVESPSAYIANETIAYRPVTIGELLTGGWSCGAGADRETDATLDCGLSGEVNPWGVGETEAWFQWGTTATELASETAKQTFAGETPVKATPAVIDGLVPNRTVYYRLAGSDQNVKPPEQLEGETVALPVPSVPPRTIGAPGVSYVRPFSAVFEGEVNPENTMSEYGFVYGTCESLASCPQAGYTHVLRSEEYQPVPVVLEARELRPATVYHCALVAVNEHGQAAIGPEGAFTTAPAPVPQAVTGEASAIGTTGAVLSGAVNPDGQPAVYRFELGLYNGPDTKLGVVVSASAGEEALPVGETQQVTGLQSGTTYAYRISVSSAYGTSYGATGTFTTLGLPAVIQVPVTLGLLPVPQTKFPGAVSVTARHATRKHKHGKRRKRAARGRAPKKRGRSSRKPEHKPARARK